MIDQKWRPIETAPRDGTWILCFGEVDDEMAWGRDPNRQVFTAQYTNHLNGANYPDKGWWQFAWFDGGYYGRCEPTHWQPLPEPPEV